MMANKSLYCLIGDPVSHSVSPSIQNYAFGRSRVDAVYIPIKVTAGALGRYIEILRDLDVKGMNVTMPHKMEVIRYIDKLDDTAERIGAVNTIVNRGGTLKGYNTDVTGTVEAIREVVGDIKGKKAIILGRGGMARAVSFSMEMEGAETKMLGRKEMAEESIRQEMKDSDIVCNCTPIGMNEEPSPIPSTLMRRNMLVVDAAYATRKTELIRSAESMGCRTITGLQLLVSQGANAFKLWTGLDPDKEGMMESARSRILEISRRGKRNVYLVGFMGSGKSSAGQLIAKILKMEFVDTDTLITKEFGRPVKDIIEALGEHEFRKMEKRTIETLSRRKGMVVATGGGAVLNYNNVYRMKESGVIVLLKVSPVTVMERLKADSSHPLLNGSRGGIDPQKVEVLLSARKCYYDVAKDTEIDTDGKGVEDVAEEIIREMSGAE
jgi:shikimate dehydrogenase